MVTNDALVIAIVPIVVIIFTLIGSAIGWFIKSRFERSRELEEKLREDRVVTYNKILEPFIIVFTPNNVSFSDEEYRDKTPTQIANEKLLSVAYKLAALKLVLVGSDPVVKSYNNLMHYFYKRTPNQSTPASEEDTKKFLLLIGHLLLEIRKSMGNEKTKLDEIQMVAWFFKDIEKL